jgi:hypothetical protein
VLYTHPERHCRILLYHMRLRRACQPALSNAYTESAE